MKTPDRPNTEKYSMKEIMLFEGQISELMFKIGSLLSRKIKNFQVTNDDNFKHRRERKTNDIHLFFELKNGQYFHLRTYTRHMLDTGRTPRDQIFLTGYIKPSISQTGGQHSFRQGWYRWNPEIIAQEIIAQNPGLFEE